MTSSSSASAQKELFSTIQQRMVKQSSSKVKLMKTADQELDLLKEFGGLEAVLNLYFTQLDADTCTLNVDQLTNIDAHLQEIEHAHEQQLDQNIVASLAVMSAPVTNITQQELTVQHAQHIEEQQE
jgi:hypothetical protein